MKFLASLLTVGTSAALDTEPVCEAIKDSKIKFKIYPAYATSTSIFESYVPKSADSSGVDSDGNPKCLQECISDNSCLFMEYVDETKTCSFFKIKTADKATVYPRPSTWTSASDSLVSTSGTNTIVKCSEEVPCGVHYVSKAWSEFSGLFQAIEEKDVVSHTPKNDANGDTADMSKCPQLCGELEKCIAFYHYEKSTDEVDDCLLFEKAVNTDMSLALVDNGTSFKFVTDGNKGYSMIKCVGNCFSNWGKDTNGCFPEDVSFSCTRTGFTLTGSLSALYENYHLLTATQKLGKVTVTDANENNTKVIEDEVTGDVTGEEFNFDENGDVKISLTWAKLAANPVYNSETKHIRFKAKIQPEEPFVKSNSVIFWTRTDHFNVQCDYPVNFKINTSYDTYVSALGATSTGTDTTADTTMIGSFTVASYSENTYKTLISADNPITVGDEIYTKISVTDLPSSLTYQILNCEIQNTANTDWSKDKQYIKLWESQTCINDQIQKVGISVGGLASSEYTFNVKAFSFQANTAEKNTQKLSCNVHVCSDTTVVTQVTCETAVTDTSKCSTGYSIPTTTSTTAA